MTVRARQFLVLSLALIATTAFADETAPAAAPVACPLQPVCPPPPPPPVPPFKVTVDLGYINTSSTGSQKDSLKAHLFGAYTRDVWTHELTADAVAAHDDAPGSVGTERYLLGAKSKRSFTPADYFFVQEQWEKDVHSDYDYQAFLSLGYGRHLIKTATQTLDAEIGVGARHSEPKASEPTNDAIGTANATYKYQFTPTASFGERMSVESGRINTVFRSVTELKEMLNAHLALSVSFDFRRDNGGTGTLDRITSINLGYQFN